MPLKIIIIIKIRYFINTEKSKKHEQRERKQKTN